MRKPKQQLSDIDYSTVIKVVKSAFGEGSYTSGFIKEVRETDNPAIQTICIDARGIVRINRDFWQKNIFTEEHVFTVVVHEFLHGLFLHTTEKKCDAIRNIATDAVINTVIYHSWKDKCAGGDFFKKFYLDTKPQKDITENEDSLVTAILSPGAHSILKGTKFEALYDRLYPSDLTGHQPPTSETVEEILRGLIPEPPKTIVLIGSHGGKDPQDGSGKPIKINKGDTVIVMNEEGEDEGEEEEEKEEDVPAGNLRRDQIQDIAEDLKQFCKGCSKSNSITDMLLNIIEDNFKDDIKKYVVKMIEKAAIAKMKRDLQPPRQILTPVPTSLSRKDVVSIAGGNNPLYYKYERKQDNRGKLIIYLDVSGSIVDRAGEIVAWLKRNEFTKKIEKVYTFSTSVTEATVDQLFAGEIKTDYGTDFDSVATHMLTLPYTRYIVFTDGECGMRSENIKALKDKNLNILSVLVEGERIKSCPGFGEVGSTVHLETK